jgi:hypothetical protein
MPVHNKLAVRLRPKPSSKPRHPNHLALKRNASYSIWTNLKLAMEPCSRLDENDLSKGIGKVWHSFNIMLRTSRVDRRIIGLPTRIQIRYQSGLEYLQ